MSKTYRATLHGNQLEWSNGRPQVLPEEQPIPVQVTIMEEQPSAPSQHSDRGQRMAEVLTRLAQLSAFPQDVDPLDWEREQRQERPLPDRDA